ncbi:halocyanin domain-containing protein [Halobaculum sp. WSA2]|uniref:Halocyanin domain-containing protein n=1 Tax=Halobaculum saliterrae TaxID=2073113 RepID=A0A6B0SQ04_9EURY|nr:halocyanin domain-containing protein [Halobaculum saliterrae]MXR40994.1 halocyanin domain-containing protein [Halobaculum saliterrae]
MSDPTTAGRDRDRPAATRRRLLAAVGAGATAALAGCSASGDGGGSGSDGDGTDRYDGWLADANGYDGEVADRTGADEVTVAVGAGDGLAYDPAAVRVSPGTTVTWEWTGMGSRHNVVDDAGGFESSYYATEGETFSHEFAEPGVAKYYCTPHENLGMVGVVEVVDG